MPLGTEVGLGTCGIVLDADSALPLGKGHNSPPTLRPTSIVAGGTPISATAELFYMCFSVKK